MSWVEENARFRAERNAQLDAKETALKKREAALSARERALHEREEQEAAKQRQEAELAVRAYPHMKTRAGDVTQNLLIENPLIDRWASAPYAVRVVSERLEWTLGDFPSKGTGWRSSGHTAGCLWAFISLADETNVDAFVAFAQRYEILDLSPTQASSGSLYNGVYTSRGRWQPCMVDGSSPQQVDPEARRQDVWFWEPLDAWRAYACEARAMLGVAESLYDEASNKAANWPDIKAEWETVLKPFVSPPKFSEINGEEWNEEHYRRENADRRGLLAHAVSQRWFAGAGLVPRLQWRQDNVPHITFDRGGMARRRAHGDIAPLSWAPSPTFSILAAQLAAAITASDRLARCSQCGRVYLVPPEKKKPDLNRTHYCGPICSDIVRAVTNRENQARIAKERKTNRSAATATLTATAEVNGHS